MKTGQCLKMGKKCFIFALTFAHKKTIRQLVLSNHFKCSVVYFCYEFL